MKVEWYIINYNLMGLWVNFKGSGGSGHPLNTLIGENNPAPMSTPMLTLAKNDNKACLGDFYIVLHLPPAPSPPPSSETPWSAFADY